MNTKTKLAIVSTLLVVAVVTLLGVITYMRSQAALKKSILRDIGNDLDVTVQRLQDLLTRPRSDVVFVTELPCVQGILNARAAGGMDVASNSTVDMWLERCQKSFAALLRINPQYWQLRFIDA